MKIYANRKEKSLQDFANKDVWVLANLWGDTSYYVYVKVLKVANNMYRGLYYKLKVIYTSLDGAPVLPRTVVPSIEEDTTLEDNVRWYIHDFESKYTCTCLYDGQVSIAKPLNILTDEEMIEYCASVLEKDSRNLTGIDI